MKTNFAFWCSLTREGILPNDVSSLSEPLAAASFISENGRKPYSTEAILHLKMKKAAFSWLLNKQALLLRGQCASAEEGAIFNDQSKSNCLTFWASSVFALCRSAQYQLAIEVHF